MKWLWVLSVILVISVLAMASAIGLAARHFQNGERIANNVFIEGVAVGNMDKQQAAQAVLQQWAPKLSKAIELRWPGGSQKISRKALGLNLDIQPAVEAAYRVGREGSIIARIIAHIRTARHGVNIPVATKVDDQALKRALEDLSKTVNRKPVNARITVRGERVHVSPETPGINLDVDASAQALARELSNSSLETFTLVTRRTQPPIRAEQLRQINTVLSSYTTRYRPSQRDRTHNLHLAMKRLSETVLMPGDHISLNQIIGPRLSERGFRPAPIFVNGEIEPSTGGGVCQVATTVYNAALLANLTVTERHHHSRPVPYVPAGLDATLYWGQLDLRIRNTLRHPVLLLGSVGGGEMTVKVLGSRADKVSVTIERSDIVTLPYTTREVPDPSLEIGKKVVETPGRNGLRVTVTRTIRTPEGKVRRQRLHTDTYAPVTAVVRVGTKPPTLPAEPTEAAGAAVNGATDTTGTVGPTDAPGTSGTSAATKSPTAQRNGRQGGTKKETSPSPTSPSRPSAAHRPKASPAPTTDE